MVDRELIFPAFAEWEILREPLRPFQFVGAGPLFESEYFPQWVEQMTVSRTENYGIEAAFEGPAPLVPNRSFAAVPNPLTVSFTDAAGAMYDLTGWVLRHETRDERGPDGQYFTRIRTHMEVQELVVRDRPEQNRVRLTDWFLNGPNA